MFALWATTALALLPTAVAEEDYGVVVSGRRFMEDEPTSFAIQINGSDARKTPLIDEDLYRSMHLIPGVQADDFSARFAVRGGDRDGVSVRIDGAPLFDPFHLQDYGGAISTVDLGLVDRAVLYRDGFPARFGDRLGGVIEIHTREAGEQPKLSAGIDLIAAHALAQVPFSEGEAMIAVRRGYLDLLIDAFSEDVELSPTYGDLFLKLQRQFGAHQRLGVYLLTATDKNSIKRSDPDRPDLTSAYENLQSWLRWDYETDSEMKMETVASWGMASRNRREGTQGTDRRDLAHGLFLHSFSGPLGEGVWRVGGQLRWAKGTYQYVANDIFDISTGDNLSVAADADVSGWDHAIFAELSPRLTRWLDISAGLRAERYPGQGTTLFSPRISVALLPFAHLALRAAWGQYTQGILPHELPVEVGVQTFGPPRQAEHRTLGVQWRPNRHIQGRLEVYQRRYSALSGHVPDFGSENRVMTQPDKAQSEGIEVEIRGQVGDAGWLLGYALSEALESIGDAPNYPRPWDRRHAVSAGLDWTMASNWSLSGAYRYHSGLPYTPVRGVRLVDEVPRLAFGEPNSARYPAFHSIDARVTRSWSLKRSDISAYLQIVNASFHENIDEYVFKPVEGASGWGVSQTTETLLPLLPTVGVEGRW